MFVGREQELGRFLAALSGPRPRIVAVRGPTGRGKTEFMKQAARRLGWESENADPRPPSLQNADLACGLHEIQGPFEDWAFPYLSVLRQVVTSIGEASTGTPHLAWFAKALGETFRSNLGRIAGAIVQDVVNKGLPQTAAIATEVLVDGLKAVSVERSLEDLTGEHRESVMAAYLTLLQQMSNSSPDTLRFVLMFDNVQIAHEHFTPALKFLARKLPASFYVVYAFNDEIQEGREFETRHWAELKAVGQLEITVPRMTAPEVRRWIDRTRGASPHISHQLLEKVCDVIDGRPFYIGWWMDSEDFAQGRVERPDNLDAYFRTDFRDLSDNAPTWPSSPPCCQDPCPSGSSSSFHSHSGCSKLGTAIICYCSRQRTCIQPTPWQGKSHGVSSP